MLKLLGKKDIMLIYSTVVMRSDSEERVKSKRGWRMPAGDVEK